MNRAQKMVVLKDHHIQSSSSYNELITSLTSHIAVMLQLDPGAVSTLPPWTVVALKFNLHDRVHQKDRHSQDTRAAAI